MIDPFEKGPYLPIGIFLLCWCWYTRILQCKEALELTMLIPYICTKCFPNHVITINGIFFLGVDSECNLLSRGHSIENIQSKVPLYLLMSKRRPILINRKTPSLLHLCLSTLLLSQSRACLPSSYLHYLSSHFEHSSQMV